MGEKGTEALHAHSNKLYRTYGCMANKVERLKCIMKEHYFLSVRPNINGLRPQARAERENKKTRLRTVKITYSMHAWI